MHNIIREMLYTDYKIENIKLMLENKKIDIDQEFEDGSMIFYAIENNKIDIVELLLQKGCLTNISNSDFDTPLIYACRLKNLEIIKLLINYKCDINFQKLFHHQTALMACACFEDSIENFNFLLDNGADINILDIDGKNCLMYAIEYQSIEIIKIILQKGTNVNLKMPNGLTPLILAMKKENLDIIKLLLDYGADPDMKNANDDTVIMMACEFKLETILDILLEKSKDINIVNRAKVSALMMTFDINITKKLLKKGANVDLKNSKNKSVFDYAPIDIKQLYLYKFNYLQYDNFYNKNNLPKNIMNLIGYYYCK